MGVWVGFFPRRHKKSNAKKHSGQFLSLGASYSGALHRECITEAERFSTGIGLPGALHRECVTEARKRKEKKGDRKLFLFPCRLTEAHKTAIRVIRKIKYFVSRRRFQVCLRSVPC